MCQHHFLNVLLCSSEAALAAPCSVRLPKNGETGHGVVLGEGKPENQNAAIIFCFGEVVQVRCWGQASCVTACCATSCPQRGHAQLLVGGVECVRRLRSPAGRAAGSERGIARPSAFVHFKPLT